MTDQGLRRVDELLTELVETVETARAVPMSSSCVLPRERMLDLLDDLREVLPPEMDEARKLIARRDEVLGTAQQQGELLVSGAAEQAANERAAATAEAAAIVADAREQADRELAAAGQEHARLVSETGIHAAATEQATSIRAEADQRAAAVLAEASEQAAAVRASAEQYATGLRVDSEGYADRTLSELLDLLVSSVGTAEQARQALRGRMRPAGGDSPISDSDGPALS